MRGNVIASLYDENDALVRVKFYEPQSTVNVSFNEKGDYVKVMWWDFDRLIPFCKAINMDV